MRARRSQEVQEVRHSQGARHAFDPDRMAARCVRVGRALDRGRRCSRRDRGPINHVADRRRRWTGHLGRLPVDPDGMTRWLERIRRAVDHGRRRTGRDRRAFDEVRRRGRRRGQQRARGAVDPDRVSTDRERVGGAVEHGRRGAGRDGCATDLVRWRRRRLCPDLVGWHGARRTVDVDRLRRRLNGVRGALDGGRRRAGGDVC